MAEDIRNENSRVGLEASVKEAIIAECIRQEEACLYSSTSLYIWLRRVRFQQQFFVAAPIIIGGFAGLSVLEEWLPTWLIAILALLGSLFPALADALKIETNVSEISTEASEYKALQDRFRQCAQITVKEDANLAQSEMKELMDRLDAVRRRSTTPPERIFKKAQAKISAGDYNFSIDH